MSLVKNSTIVVGGVMVSNLLAYLFHIIAGRLLGPLEYGVFGALMSLFLLITMPTAALASAIAKFTSRFHSANDIEKIAALRKKIQKEVLFVVSILLVFIILFSQPIASYLKIDSSFSVVIVGISIAGASFLPVNIGVLQGMKKFKVLSWNGIIEAATRLVLLMIFLYFGYGVNGAILVYGLASFVAYLLVFPSLKELRVGSFTSDKLDAKPVYKFVGLVLIVHIVMQTLLNVPALIIKHYYSSELTGYWASAMNIARLSLLVTVAIATAQFPEIVREGEYHLRRKIFRKAQVLVLISSSLMALVFFLLPDVLIRIIYGSAYLGAVPFLQWLGIAMIFIGLLHIWANYLLARLK